MAAVHKVGEPSRIGGHHHAGGGVMGEHPVMVQGDRWGEGSLHHVRVRAGGRRRVRVVRVAVMVRVRVVVMAVMVVWRERHGEPQPLQGHVMVAVMVAVRPGQVSLVASSRVHPGLEPPVGLGAGVEVHVAMLLELPDGLALRTSHVKRWGERLAGQGPGKVLVHCHHRVGVLDSRVSAAESEGLAVFFEERLIHRRMRGHWRRAHHWSLAG